ncbi:hypothetical protein BAE44_0005575 [Dichanthelium oligosanthes]|uniref:Uncharacterized protein n=1 Tax=Dichanthelium oligosanthes TaxID=888268 RepID=A0A1E5W7L3_9POAL|nr:hypothetical protein BAE44_0005575 [Dichanthelium oligosanthes]
MMDLEKKEVTLGAKGKKLGMKRCIACGLYMPHNPQKCPTLEHNQQHLAAMRNRKSGSFTGAKNKKKITQQVDGSEGA